MLACVPAHALSHCGAAPWGVGGQYLVGPSCEVQMLSVIWCGVHRISVCVCVCVCVDVGGGCTG